MMRIVLQQVPDIGGERSGHQLKFRKLFVEQMSGMGAAGVGRAEGVVARTELFGETELPVECEGEGADSGQQRAEHQDQRQPAVQVAPADQLHGRIVRPGRHRQPHQIAPQIAGKLPDLLITLLRVRGERFADDRLQVRVDRRMETVFERLHPAVGDVRQNLRYGVAGESGFQSGGFEQDCAHCEQVRPLVAQLVPDDLRRKVLRCSAEIVLLRRCFGRILRMPDAPGDAPVHDVGFAEFADHDVRRLQVAVHDVAAVRIFERIADFEQDVEAGTQSFLFVERVYAVEPVVCADLFEVGLEGLPLDQLHREVQPRFPVGIQRVDRHDRRMVELGGDPRFGEEEPPQPLVSGKFAAQRLQGDQPVQPAVETVKQFALAALREFFSDVVALLEQFEALFVAGEIDLPFGRMILKLLHDGVDVAPFFQLEETGLRRSGEGGGF